MTVARAVRSFRRLGLKASFASLVVPLLADSPLRHPRFRLFYFGAIGTALGYTMQTTVAAWVMATLTPSEIMVALVQSASTAPALLFGLIAGTLADIADRRRLIIGTQYLLLAATLILGAATLAGLVGPWTLLTLTFLVGSGLTLYQPAQSTSVHDLVEQEELPRAVALNAVAFNVARAIGPALAGGVAAWLGSGNALVTSAIFFVPMILAGYRLAKHHREVSGIPETVFAGALSGLRFARNSPAMRPLLVRNVSFSLCASAFWALLPVIARDQLHLGAGGFGLLSAGFGAGAIAGALLMPGQLERRSLNVVVIWASIFWVAAIALLAFATLVPLAIVITAITGAAWVSVLAGLSAGVQTSAPGWVRARAVSVNLVATQASLALGSALWGLMASVLGLRGALLGSAAAMLLLLAVTRRRRVAMGVEADVAPGAGLPELLLAAEPRPDDGPVLVELEYWVDEQHRPAFLRAIHAAESVRRRNGAIRWRVFRDLGEDGRFVERFIVASWGEYVRSRARLTVADRDLQQRIERLQRTDAPARVTRLIGIDASSETESEERVDE
jgi:MFS family permease